MPLGAVSDNTDQRADLHQAAMPNVAENTANNAHYAPHSAPNHSPAQCRHKAVRCHNAQVQTILDSWSFLC